MTPISTLVKRIKCIPQGGPFSPIYPNRPVCLSRDEEVAIIIVGVFCGAITAWCASVWLSWIYRSRQRERRLRSRPLLPRVQDLFRTISGSGSSVTMSAPSSSSQDHYTSYPPRPLSEESMYRSLSGHMTPRPAMEERFSLPMLSANGALLPDADADARPRGQARLPETPPRALPIPPAHSPRFTPASSSHGFYEAGDVGLVPLSARSPPPGGQYSGGLFHSEAGHAVPARSYTPLSTHESGGPSNDRPYGYQPQTYSPVPGFTPKSSDPFSDTASETGALMPHIAQPPSPTASMHSERESRRPPGPRHNKTASAGSQGSFFASPMPTSASASTHRQSPLASPTGSTNSRRSLLNTFRSPLSASDSGSGSGTGAGLPKHRSPLPPIVTPGPFAWGTAALNRRDKGKAASLSATSPVAASRPRSLLVDEPTLPAVSANAPSHAGLAPPATAVLLTPPARASSHVPSTASPRANNGLTFPLPAPKPLVPALQLLSQNTMAMFDSRSESSDGHTPPRSVSGNYSALSACSAQSAYSAPSAYSSQDTHSSQDTNPWRPLSLARRASKHLGFGGEPAVSGPNGPRRLPAAGEVSENGRVERVVVHKPSWESLVWPSQAKFEDMGDGRRV